MHVLVTGASGYIGSRLVPRLVRDGHRVTASFSHAARAEELWWREQVSVAEMDVLDADQVRAAVQGQEAVVYLIHGMGGDDFAETDRRSAETMAAAAAEAGVRRIVYLSGTVPEGVAEEDLSEHMASRREVERILTSRRTGPDTADAADTATEPTTITLRAAMIVGSGSTSFEIVRQISERLALQMIPDWMSSTVQPIAVDDVLQCLAAAVVVESASRSYDLGGPEALPYAELLQVYADEAGLERPQIALPGVSSDVVGTLSGWLTDVPTATVQAIMASLHHDMVAGETDFLDDLLPEGYVRTGLRESFRRSLAEPEESVPIGERDPVGALPQDPAWSRGGHSSVATAVATAASGLAAKVVEVTGRDASGGV